MEDYKKELLSVIQWDIKYLNTDLISVKSLEKIADILGIDLEEVKSE